MIQPGDLCVLVPPATRDCGMVVTAVRYIGLYSGMNRDIDGGPIFPAVIRDAWEVDIPGKKPDAGQAFVVAAAVLQPLRPPPIEQPAPPVRKDEPVTA